MEGVLHLHITLIKELTVPGGRLIVVTGGEGAGKTSVVSRLVEEFPDWMSTREPGGTPLGEALRGLILSDLPRDPMTDFALFFAARNELVSQVVNPALAAGRTIVTDRYLEGTFVYQWRATCGREDLDPFFQAVRWYGFPFPSLNIWLDVQPLIGLQRKESVGELNAFDRKPLDFHQRVWSGMEEWHRIIPEQSGGLTRSVRIDAHRPLDDVYQMVKQVILG